MSTPRRSTPRRARSSSVTSNTSATSTTTPSTRKSTKKSSTAGKEKDNSNSTSKSTRPPLPTRLNPVLPEKAPEVKLQIIRRETKEITIGRVKLPTVNHSSDHAFLLRRFDTDAMAASSMFRVAFPYAGEEAERKEMAYLEERFDCSAANGGSIDETKGSTSKKGRKKTQNKVEGELPEGSTGVKLQGTWIPSSDALELAKEYGLAIYASPLIEAKFELRAGETVPQLIKENSSSSSVKATPRGGKRQRVKEDEDSITETSTSATTSNGSPTLVQTKTTKSIKPNGVEEVVVEKTETSVVSDGTALTPEEIEEQIKASKNLVKDVKNKVSNSLTNGIATPSRKRRAINDAPTAEGSTLDDDEEDGNAVIRTFRRGTRVARRRPITGTIGAGVAVGAASLAWVAGGNLDVAMQILQNGATQVGSWFF